VIATATNTVVATIPVGRDDPNGIAVTPDGAHAYVTNVIDSTVSVIATASNTVVGSPIPVGALTPSEAPAGTLAITPDGTAVYVPDDASNTVSVIATATNAVVATIPVGNLPLAVAFPPAAFAPPSGTTCNGTYNGTFKGNIIVSAGQNCRFVAGDITGNVLVTGGNFAFANGLIGGNVAIGGASTFSLGPGATINGSVAIGLVAPGTTTNQICGSKVLHDVAVAGNASPFQLGAASSTACAGNSIGGSATVDFSTAPAAVYNNSIGGTLSCLFDASITGGGNTAQRKLGQCAAF
jgi:YVTN family beta-propeller protein